jgi:pyruvate/2-oxoglutarate dehydrogenase complex dihydrolipoamide acyltransferase (E2) component
VSSSTTESLSASHPPTTVDVTMPQMGVSVAEGTVVAWRVEVGDRVAAEQTICEISTDKIDTEVPAPVGGVVAEIIVGVEETVEVGVVLARIATGADAGDAILPPPSAPAPGDAILPPPSAPAPGDAILPPPSAPEPGDAILPPPPAPEPTSPSGRRRYSPVVQRIAAEHDIDLSAVVGTGRDGRVRKQDVLAFVDANGAEPAEPPMHIESPYRPDPSPAPAAVAAARVEAASPGAAPASPGAAPASPGADGGGLSRMRRQIGQHMKRSLDTAATCTTWIEADMGRVEAARARLGVTALAFVARATIEALREYPALNAWLEGDRYTRVDDVNLGIAVSLGDDGLIVPVIHRAHELSVEGLAARIRELARRARDRSLSADDVAGGTFTITNPGQYGSIMATPIINQPQVGILDLEAVVKRPVVLTDPQGTDSIAIRPMTILGLSWDHRALDGVLSAQFLAGVKRRLEGVVV